MIHPDPVRRAYEAARDELYAAREPAGYWVGELSSSALSTATATSALSVVAERQPRRSSQLRPLISGGVEYLAGSQNDDGGWGDTDKSLSNISTTMLVRAAFHLAGRSDDYRSQLERAERYIELQGGIPGLRKRYGRDRTFVVPILTNCALAGIVRWGEVSPLPFELACFPQPLYRFLRMPVVSYAIPALVAIGQARYFHRKPGNPVAQLVRKLSVVPSLRSAERMQPESGGYLEATPLTSFVVMSLAATGRAEHPIVQNGVRFLIDSVRDDGSWPIDTNLATWVTTLSVKALSASEGSLAATQECLDWLLSCQHQGPHPFTGAAPGGWGWTDLSGGVPDADDTSGALLALAALKTSASDENRMRIDHAAGEGVRWLMKLQNADGGWPTFCRGWGKLPFDRSGVDLTAHAIRAIAAWRKALRVSAKSIERGLAFLESNQRSDGSWVPLWFGNQHRQDEENPVYGTANVLLAYRDLGMVDSKPARQAVTWLAGSQNPDGGWGGDPTASGSNGSPTSGVEETAMAVQALLSAELTGSPPQHVLDRGIGWLTESVQSGRYRQSSPIGFYFAKLWYYEKLYPVIFTVAALGQALRQLEFEPDPQTSPSQQL